MDSSIVTQFISFILHIDTHLFSLTTVYGNMVYLILFAIVFCETGLVIIPFLPGDSLLFAAGALAGAGYLQYNILIVLLLVAAILGDVVNYVMGSWFGLKVLNYNFRFLNKNHFLKAEMFYEKYGGKAVILARFVPIIRTLVPFIAGVARMHGIRFLTYNVIGGFIWVVGLVSAGYFLGNIQVVKQNFSAVIYGIILLSLLPLLFESIQFIYSKKSK